MKHGYIRIIQRRIYGRIQQEKEAMKFHYVRGANL
jgi:hypothetical protein